MYRQSAAIWDISLIIPLLLDNITCIVVVKGIVLNFALTHNQTITGKKNSEVQLWQPNEEQVHVQSREQDHPLVSVSGQSMHKAKSMSSNAGRTKTHMAAKSTCIIQAQAATSLKCTVSLKQHRLKALPDSSVDTVRALCKLSLVWTVSRAVRPASNMSSELRPLYGMSSRHTKVW